MRFSELKIAERKFKDVSDGPTEGLWSPLKPGERDAEIDIIKISDPSSSQQPLWMFQYEAVMASVYHDIEAIGCDGAKVEKLGSKWLETQQDIDTANLAHFIQQHFYLDSQHSMLCVTNALLKGSLRHDRPLIVVSDDLLYKFFPDYNPERTFADRLKQAFDDAGVLEVAALTLDNSLVAKFHVGGQTFNLTLSPAGRARSQADDAKSGGADFVDAYPANG